VQDEDVFKKPGMLPVAKAKGVAADRSDEPQSKRIKGKIAVESLKILYKYQKLSFII
jgi:hypothetical protein